MRTARFKLGILALVLWAGLAFVHAQTTSFIYQGQLADGGGPANGNYDFQFTLLDTNGNPVVLSASRWKHIFSPELGLAASYYPSRHFRVELEGSAFGWPHHYYIWNGDLTLNYRVFGHFEVRAGENGFGFKTSTTSDYYVKGKWEALFLGVRWYSNSE